MQKIESRISAAIRYALDDLGIELTWSDTDAAAAAVANELSEELEKSWQYDELCD